MKKLIGSSLLAVTAVISAHSHGGGYGMPNEEAHGYIGLDYGEVEIDSQDFDDGDIITGTLGWKTSRHFAVELNYVDFSKSRSESVAVGFPDDSLEIQGTSFNFSVLLMLPLEEKFNLFARAGYTMWDADLRGSRSGKVETFNGEDPLYGLGVEYTVHESLSALIQWQRWSLKDSGSDFVEIDGDLSSITAGIRYTF